MENRRFKLIHSGPIKQHRLLDTPEACKRRSRFLKSEIGKQYLKEWHRHFNYQKIKSALMLGYGVEN